MFFSANFPYVFDFFRLSDNDTLDFNRILLAKYGLVYRFPSSVPS